MKGSCLCGKVSFKIEGDFDSFFLCHCTFCRKDTGSAHAANLFSSNARLEWCSGRELVKTYKLPSTRHTKSFCSVCGSAVPTEQPGENLVVVPAGSLDDKIEMRPTAHIFLASKAEWEQHSDAAPGFDALPQK